MSPFSHGVIFIAVVACFSAGVSGSEQGRRKHSRPDSGDQKSNFNSADQHARPANPVNSKHIQTVDPVNIQYAHPVNSVSDQHAHPVDAINSHVHPVNPVNSEDARSALSVFWTAGQMMTVGGDDGSQRIHSMIQRYWRFKRSAQSISNEHWKMQHAVGSTSAPAALKGMSDLHVPDTVRSLSKRKAGKQKVKTGRRQKMGHTDALPAPQQSVSEEGDARKQRGSVDRQVSARASSELFPKLLQQQPKVEGNVRNPSHSATATDDEDMVVVYKGLDGKMVNMTQLLSFLSQQDFRRQLNREAQWAYMCLVVVICGMMWTMWYLGGLKRCRHRSNTTPVSHDQHLMDVHEVLRKQQRYLPMFSEPEWEEVLMCDRATDP